MIAFLCFLLGMLLTLAALVVWAVYLAVTTPAPTSSSDQLTRLTQLQAERRLSQLSQDAVASMLRAVRPER